MERDSTDVPARKLWPGVCLSVAVPVCDEADNISAMLAELTRAMESRSMDYEVVVVDDGSSDSTAEIVASIARRDTRVRLVRHRRNEGYGAALRTGLVSARKDVICLTDGDRQYDLDEIDRLLGGISGADVVVGYRDPRRDPFLRRMNGRAWSWLVRLLFGVTTRDVDCAFKVLRHPVIENLRGEILSKGAAFSAELLVRAQRAGFRIHEVPLSNHRPRPAGRPSGARLRVIWRALLELLRLRIALWREDLLTVSGSPRASRARRRS